jgi:CHAT domain-containing protein
MCRAAAAAFGEIGDRLNQAKALNSVMEAQIGLQRPVEAIRTYFEAVGLLDENSPQHREVLAGLENNMGKACHDLGLLYEANVAWEKALRLLPSDGKADLKAQLRMNLGVLKNAVGDAEAALTQFSSALEMLRGVNPMGEARCLLNVGAAQIQLRKWDEAEATIREAESKFDGLNDSRMKARCGARLAYIALMRGQVERALDIYKRTVEIAEKTGDRTLRAMASGGLGMAQEKLGRLAEAEASYAKGLEEAGELRRSAEEAELAAKIAEGFAELPGDLAAVLVKQSKVEAAFATAQIWKGSVVREALLSSPEMQQGLGESQAQRYGELRRALEQAEEIVRETATDAPDFREKLSRQDEALRDLRLFEKSLRGRLPALSNGDVTLEQLAKELGRDGVLVEYLAGQDRICILVVSQEDGKPRIVSKIAPVDTARFRRSVVNYATQLADPGGLSEDLLAKQAEQIYATLLGPVEEELAEKRRLIICPDQYLHGIPFTTLLDGKGRFLIERFAVAVAPSAAAWEASRRLAATRRGTERGQIMLVARSQFEGQVREGNATRDSRFLNYQELPNVRREAEAVAAIPGASVRKLSENEATVEAVKQTAPGAGILHFATHASSNDTRPLYGHLVLAPTTGTDSGLLFAQDVLGMKLSAELAVLSACETAKGYMSGEGMIGLAWSFLVAGCPATIATGWQLNDESAASWVSAFYRGLLTQKQSKAESFRRACLALLATKGKKQDFSSPRRWGTWSLVGDDS